MPVKKIRKWLLKRKIANTGKRLAREVKLQPWEHIRTIGIVYEVMEEQDFLRFSRFVTSLQNEKKEVRTFGLVASREIPSYCTTRLNFEYLYRKDRNWLGWPTGLKVNDFVAREFDLMINLDMKCNVVMDYIAGHSKAKLKAAIYRKEMSALYDLMISGDQLSSKEALAGQVIHWIKQLCPLDT
jgi:hypothetical protein